VTVVVVAVVDDVAPAIVDVVVDIVVEDVVVVGEMGLEQELLQTRATLFCSPAPSLSQLHAVRLRRFCLRQPPMSMRRFRLQLRTQPKVMVQRPPPVERQRRWLGIAPMQSVNSVCTSLTHVR